MQGCSPQWVHCRGRGGRPVCRREVLWDVRVPGLGLRLLPSGRKNWVLRYRPRGGRRRIVDLADLSRLNLEKAREKARRARTVLDEGPFAAGEEVRSLAELHSDFSEDRKERVVAGRIRSSSAKRSEERFSALVEVMGGHSLDAIDERTARLAFDSSTGTHGADSRPIERRESRSWCCGWPANRISATEERPMR